MLSKNPRARGPTPTPAGGGPLVFGGMAIYTTCKNNTFNGMPLPGIYSRTAGGDIRELASFGYRDFKHRLGSP